MTSCGVNFGTGLKNLVPLLFPNLALVLPFVTQTLLLLPKQTCCGGSMKELISMCSPNACQQKSKPTMLFRGKLVLFCPEKTVSDRKFWE